MTDLHPSLTEFLDAHLEELIAFRRRLHAHPERSGAEHETTAAVEQRLAVAGLAPRVLPTGTGLVCDVPATPARGLRVALRADLDALAMDDEKDVAYRSQIPGVAHACGHDVHTTIVLGCGLALCRLLAEPGAPPGSVRLVFEPAEETAPGGALDVIASGGLDGVGIIFGVHCDPRLDTGVVGTRAGAITSAADLVEITLHGPGGHTARPDQTADLVRVVARVATELPDRLAEAARGHGEVTLVFGAIQAGDAANVIPAVAVLRGTLRTPDRAAWDEAPGLLRGLVTPLLEGTGATVAVRHERGVPPVVNDAAATQILSGAARAALGQGTLVETAQSAGGDDFSWYLERVPGSYGRLGVHDPRSTAPRVDLHASTFDVDERAIAVGIRWLTRAVLDALSRADDRERA